MCLGVGVAGNGEDRWACPVPLGKEQAVKSENIFYKTQGFCRRVWDRPWCAERAHTKI